MLSKMFGKPKKRIPENCIRAKNLSLEHNTEPEYYCRAICRYNIKDKCYIPID